MSKQAKKAHEGQATNRDFMVMTVPLYLMAFFFYGPRVLLLALVAVVTASLADRICAMLRGRLYDKTDNISKVVAAIIVLLLPATVPIRVVVVAVLVAVFVGKAAFGGAGSYPFNPAAVGFCVVAVSWPQQVYSYPAPLNWMLIKNPTWQQLWRLWRFEGITLTEGPAATLRSGGLPKIDFWNLLLGNYAGPLGVSCTLVIAACALYLLVKKRLPPIAPVAFVATMVLAVFLFPRYTEISFKTFPGDIMLRLQVIKYEILSGSIVFAAVFLVAEPATLPKNRLSQLIYGVLLGVAAVLFRYYGNYELGTCFALLIVNAISGYFDRAIARGSARKGVATP